VILRIMNVRNTTLTRWASRVLVEAWWGSSKRVSAEQQQQQQQCSVVKGRWAAVGATHA
jgi:hypothetical protein